LRLSPERVKNVKNVKRVKKVGELGGWIEFIGVLDYQLPLVLDSELKVNDLVGFSPNSFIGIGA
jgi:hypothetical protein